MKNKVIAGVIIAIAVLSIMIFWYFSPSNVSIISIEGPEYLVIGQLDPISINLQNNASENVNVNVNVKNAFVDKKGESLKGFTILAYGNESNMSEYISPNAVDRPQKEVLLKPGSNIIIVSIGYEVPGTQNIEVEIFQNGRLADSRTIAVNVSRPKIGLQLLPYRSANKTNEIHAVYGYLGIQGKGYAQDISVNISVINELDNTTVSTVTRQYSLVAVSKVAEEYPANDHWVWEPFVDWNYRNTRYDPLTGARIDTDIETYAPIVVIELSSGDSSTEKYIMSPIVVKGKAKDKYKVVAAATWKDQVVRSEIRIPSPSAFITGESIWNARFDAYD